MHEELDDERYDYELSTWAKVAIFCMKGGLCALGFGLTCLGIGAFTSPFVREKKIEGN